MLATHNEQSVAQAVQRMKELGIAPQSGEPAQTRHAPDAVAFGQLLGMCDFVSFPLAYAGYRAYKYTPYGPIDLVIPYLLRRAQENSTVLGNAPKERRLLRQAIAARLWA